MNRQKTLISILGLNVCLFSCEMKRNIKNSPGGPNPNYPSEATQPEGSAGSVRNELPANGHAVTGTGNTASDTSAASGAVNMEKDTSPQGKAGDVNRPESLGRTYTDTDVSAPDGKSKSGGVKSDSAENGISGSGSTRSDHRP